MTALKNDTSNAISAMKEVANEQATTLAELERGASFTSDQVTKLQQEVRVLTNSVSQLNEKCTDLESRSRRQNLPILNIKEGEEKGQNIRDFIAKVLQSALALDTPPMIDRAHRSTVIQSSRNNIHPRTFIIKLHYFHDWEIESCTDEDHQLQPRKDPHLPGFATCHCETTRPLQQSQGTST